MLRTLRCWVALIGLMSVVACGPPPRLPEEVAEPVALPVADSALARTIQSQAVKYPGKSGVLSLEDGRDAFAARVALARAAERTLDVQYYIWRPDMTGLLVFEALLEAADRGVKVRLLLDDNNGRD